MINGIINVYKEKGFTSFDVVAKMRGIVHQKKIGHTGTLDPDAEGVLPVCLGKATKVCDLLTDKDKEYEAILLLGQETDTQDITGQVLNKSEVLVLEEEVRQVIASFVGEYQQIPPMYSALKVQGQKLCDLARKGITVERKARNVQIFSIDIEEIILPRVRMRVHCSKGTYIRTLCDDIGKKLGCFGCMESLLRTRVADFSIQDAKKLDEIEQLFEEQRYEEILHPVDGIFKQYRKVTATIEAAKLLDNGNRIPEALLEHKQEIGEQETVRLYNNEEKFVGLYEHRPETADFKPIKIFKE